MNSDPNMRPLREVASFQEGYVNPSQRYPDYFGNDYKWLRATDLNNGFVYETGRGLSTKGFLSAGKSAILFEPGTLAISKSGTIGRVGILKDRMCGNRAVINIRPNASIDTNFLFYSLLYLRPTIETLAEGSVQRNLYISQLGKLLVPVPPLSLQRSIGNLLLKLDLRVETLRDANATLESISQALFKSWFIDFDPVSAKVEGREPDGMDAATATLFPAEFEESSLGLIPKGWRAETLAAICTNPRAQAKPDQISPDTTYIGLEHMPRKSIALDAAGTAEGLESAKFWFERGDVLFGKLRPYFHKVGLAPCRGVCSTDILVLRPKTAEWLGFLAMHASSDALISHTTQLSNGARMPRTSWHDVGGFNVVLPSKNVTTAFNAMIGPMFARIHVNIEAARMLAELRNLLLPRLISGKLRLPEAQTQLEEANA